MWMMFIIPADVNNLILQWMKSGEYELTKENYEDYIAKEKAFLYLL